MYLTSKVKRPYPKNRKSQPKRIRVKSSCVICNSEFDAYSEAHTHCSKKCLQKAYVLRYPERKRESIRKSSERPLAKLKHRVSNRNRKLHVKYGMTEDTFKDKLKEQNYRCKGCEKELDEFTARIDHSHTTGKVRGILCDHCNWSIGHAKDSIRILKNLTEYLIIHD